MDAHNPQLSIDLLDLLSNVAECVRCSCFEVEPLVSDLPGNKGGVNPRNSPDTHGFVRELRAFSEITNFVKCTGITAKSAISF